MSRPLGAHRLDRLAVPEVTRASRRDIVTWAVVAALCAAWAAAVIGGATGLIARTAQHVDWLLPAGPVATGLLVLLSRPHSTGWMKLAFGTTLTTACAVEAASLLGSSEVYAAVPGLMALAAVAALRWPVATILAVVVLSGTFGSIEAFTSFPTGPMTDVLLGAGWLAVAWGWLTGRRELPAWLPIPLALLAAYLAITALYVLFADSLEPALYSFRASAWLMAAALLVAFILPEERQQQVAHRGILLAATAVGAYAMVRWAIGPAGKEEELVRQAGPFVLGDNGEVRLFGSLPNPTALGVWCSAVVPFAFASALSPIGARWRLVALAAAGMCGAALAGADSRASMVAAVTGAGTVIVLFATGRGFEGRRALPLALGAMVLMLGGGVFAATKLSDEGSSGARFRGLLDPIKDRSVQDRLVKWDTVLADMDERPWGHGLGASGIAEQKYARFTSAATFDPDSSYVKVAYDQGFMIMLLFIAALLAVAIGLGQRAIRAPDAHGGMLALGACGTLVAFATALGAGVYFEGLLAAVPWVIVGLGMAPYLRAMTDRRADTA